MSIIKFWFDLVVAGKISIDKVPEKYRPHVVIMISKANDNNVTFSNNNNEE